MQVLDSSVVVLFAITLFIILIIIAVRIFIWASWFRDEKRFFDIEIKRTSGKERAQWRRRRSRFICSNLPVIRLFYRKK